ncbi:MAG: hypothetical protein DMG96_23580, partial [Acidobacteria bacterium]
MSHPQPDRADHDMAHNSAHPFAKTRKDGAASAIRLAWSAALTKINRTFLSAEGRAESRGGSSIFSIYRYKVAAKPVELPPWPTFYERAQNVLAAKEEIDREIDYRKRTGGFSGKFEVYHDDIDALRDQIK